MLSRRVFHSFRWALQPVKHISSRRFARLSSHLLCNATVPFQFHLAVPLSRLTGNWQVTTTICNNLWNFCTRARQFPNRSEAKKRQELKDSQSESVLGSDLVFSVLCWLWQLVLWHFDYATHAFTSYSYKFFNKSDKSKTPPTLSLRPPVAWHVSNSSEILAPNCNIYRTTRKQAVPVLNNPQKNPNIRSTRH